MVERGQHGYVLKIVSQPPFHPWWRITAHIAQALSAYGQSPEIISSVGVYTPSFGLGSLENPRMVGAGAVDIGITNPPITARLAMEGRGPYQQSVGSLRALARFPEPDYIFWLVAEELGIGSMQELAQLKPPLRLVSGRIGPMGPDTLTFTVEEVMKRHGFSYQDIEAWGGRVFFPGASTEGVPLVQGGQADAIFQEGVHNVIWEDLAEARPMRCLKLSDEAIQSMKDTYGFDSVVIPKGRLKGIDQELETIEFGGWLVFCREDLPDELAELLAKTCVEQSDPIAAPYKHMPPHRRSLEVPITPQHLCTRCEIPLHKGAESYYREIGCL